MGIRKVIDSICLSGRGLFCYGFFYYIGMRSNDETSFASAYITTLNSPVTFHIQRPPNIRKKEKRLHYRSCRFDFEK